MKIVIRKNEPYEDVHGDYTEQEWDWVLRADNGWPIAQSMFTYRRRSDAIRGMLVTLGLALPDRPKGCKSQQLRSWDSPTMRRGGLDRLYVSYGAGGQVRFAQWTFLVGHDEEFFELVEE